MSGFSDEERMALLEPLAGLQIDPTKEAGSMQQIDPGAAGAAVVDADLSAYYGEYGKKATDRAYARGWRPKEEHKGNPDNWVDPVDFFDRYAENSDKRADRAAQKRLEAIERTVETRMGELNKRVDRIDETDRQATEEYYADAIARAAPSQVPALLKARDQALLSIKKDAAGKAPEGNQPGVAPETRDFFAKHPYLATPSNADDHAMRGWAIGRAAELEAKHPGASLEQVYNQLSAELNAKREPMTQTNQRQGGRALSDNGGGGGMRTQRTGKMTPADMTAEQKSAFNTLVNLKAYKATDAQRYCDDLSRSEAELAMKGKN